MIIAGRNRYFSLSRRHRLVRLIMNVTAAMEMPMPIIMLAVSGSPNISVPTRMAVMGSNTPSTDALVAPMLREATASVAVDTIVGSTALYAMGYAGVREQHSG